MKAAVICNGETDTSVRVKRYISEADLVICCDGGVRLCGALGITPHIVAGDFDSADMALVKEFEKKGSEIITVPCEKDFTDGELGVRTALERGADDITLTGCVGCRLDHTIANCHMLMLPLKAGAKARLVNSHNTVYLTDGKIGLEVKKGQIISLIPLTTEAKGVTTEGLYYALDKAVLKIGSSYGISNIAVSERVSVEVSQGALFVILSED